MIVVLQSLELLLQLAALILLMMGRPGYEVAAAAGLLYGVHLSEVTIEWRRRKARGEPCRGAFFLYFLPGVVLARRLGELAIATLFFRAYLAILIGSLILTLPLILLDRRDLLAHRLGALHDRMDRAVEPLFDALLRAHNAISLNPHPPGETALILAVFMPFRERLV